MHYWSVEHITNLGNFHAYTNLGNAHNSQLLILVLISQLTCTVYRFNS